MIAARVFLIFYLAISLSGCEQKSEAVVSPFNNLIVNPNSDSSDYRFVVFGHMRANHREASPNAVMREHVDRILESKPAFVMHLGDMYYHIDGGSMEAIQEWIQERIDAPFFNAVGNHDTMGGGYVDDNGEKVVGWHDTEVYQQRFGPLYYRFTLGSAMFIVLDTARDFGMSRAQRRFLEESVMRAQENVGIKNVFVFSHMVFWSYYNPDMQPLFQYRHPIHPPVDKNLFQDVVRPVLLPLITKKRVFLMAGDLGGGGSYLQTYYHRDKEFTYVATGMGRTSRDAFIVVSVVGDEVELEYRSFSGKGAAALTSFNAEYWNSFYLTHPQHAARVDRGFSARRPD